MPVSTMSGRRSSIVSDARDDDDVRGNDDDIGADGDVEAGIGGGAANDGTEV